MTLKKFYGKGLPGVDLADLRGKLIVLEGSDGSGRTSHIKMLRDWLESRGYATEEIGLKRSMLVGDELEEAKQGNIMGPFTQSLFYATDFADQLQNKIIPALRSSFVVLADRYIYTLIARAIVRDMNPQWLNDIYGIALIPDAVFYLEVSPYVLAQRIFRKGKLLDYWESGMDILKSGNMYTNFIKYQKQMSNEFVKLQKEHKFEVINGNRPLIRVQKELQDRVENILKLGSEGLNG